MTALHDRGQWYFKGPNVGTAVLPLSTDADMPDLEAPIAASNRNAVTLKWDPNPIGMEILDNTAGEMESLRIFADRGQLVAWEARYDSSIASRREYRSALILPASDALSAASFIIKHIDLWHSLELGSSRDVGVRWEWRELPRHSQRHTELHDLNALRDGWAGEGSVAPKRSALADAEECLALLRQKGITTPTVSASASGEVFFHWSTGKGRASASFEGDGYFGYALYKDGRSRAGDEDCNLETGILPNQLISYLREIYGA